MTSQSECWADIQSWYSRSKTPGRKLNRGQIKTPPRHGVLVYGRKQRRLYLPAFKRYAHSLPRVLLQRANAGLSGVGKSPSFQGSHGLRAGLRKEISGGIMVSVLCIPNWVRRKAQQIEKGFVVAPDSESHLSLSGTTYPN